MVLSSLTYNTKELITWSSAGVKHANTVHILGFDWPKQIKKNAMRRKQKMHCTSIFSTCIKWRSTCLGIIKFQEESGLRDAQLAVQDRSDRGAQLLVHIGIQTTDWHQLAIGSRLLGTAKSHGDWPLQHNHHILPHPKHKFDSCS